MRPKLESYVFARVSTSHVSLATAQLLDNTPSETWPCVGGGYAYYGWFVYAHDENCGVGDQRIPDDLFAVMTWARQQGVSHLLFDRDGDQVDELPYFDW